MSIVPDNSRLIVRYIVLFYCSCAFFALNSCERESSAGLIKLEKTDSANHYSLRPVIQFVDSSALRAQISAGWAKVYDKIRRKYLGGGLNVEFFNKYGIPASNLTADSAVIEDDTKNMTALGTVVVTSAWTKTTVKTTELKWDDAKKKLHSDKFVDIASPTELLQGYGFESDANLEHYTIYKVTGQTLLMGGTNASVPVTSANVSSSVPMPNNTPPTTKTKTPFSTTSIIQR